MPAYGATVLDGGGKLLTAVLLVACGALGALVFSRDEALPAAPTAQTYGHNDTLVRRTTGPITLDLGQESAVVVPTTPSAALTPPQTAALGQLAAPIDARPKGRLAAEYPAGSVFAPPPATDAFQTATDFPAPSSSFADSPDGRRPLNNLLSTPRLPERFPGAELEATSPAAPPAPPADAAANPRPMLGPPTTSGAPSAGASTSAGRMTPISSTVRTEQPQPAASQPAIASASSPPDVNVPPRRFVPLKLHTVRDGDTLADLSRRYYGDDTFAAALFEANRGVLSSPELLPIGAVLTIPARDLAIAGPASPAVESGTTPTAVLVPKPEFNPYGAPPTGAAAPSAAAQP